LHDKGAFVRRVSSVFETEPVGFRDQPWFLNIAIEIETALSPHQLLAVCQEIEAARGRTRPFQWAPRTLDLDILLYGDRIVEEPYLQIPHPRMAQRRFVLEPLTQIAPALVHPVSHQTIAALLASCPDPATVIHHSELTGW
jgi:2-amino-4-hydroxy-6-hydroxymethyldihydropteridine diphosphokinase